MNHDPASEMPKSRPPGDYGIDAPRLLIVPVVLMGAGIAQAVVQQTFWPLVGTALILSCCLLALYASRVGKFVVWGRLLDELKLRGSEEVVDLGCGRGALLISAAQRVPAGRAVGVDLWRADQSGNNPDATMRNAAAAGVADRVELHTGNLIQLPLADESFDVVVSNVAVHNLKALDDRDRAMNEAVRVLRPGGRLLIADLSGTRQYQQRLRHLGMAEVSRRGLGWRLWWSGPWLSTHLVSARKPS
ncbi:class I SAM-dependent methyltransferase [Micromonospora sp. NPDC005174]|uniref:class I SAM-dependent methyltransferase n=1 Tax=unclassified Micromonospora TaxID=2617518 RepID=UPI0033B050D3